ncbi:MAG TPA: TIGR03435 family protein [Vicinamibacterales bacterium]|nr:TIGR03435 family protein [Vicinamibacterales bacterium]
MRLLRTIASLAAAVTIPLLAQAPARFEAASIKPNRSGDIGIGGSGGVGGTYRRTNVTMLRVLAEAYGDRFFGFEIIGGPSWIGMDKFDVVARTDGARYTSEMLRKLVVDRFKLRSHEETRVRDVYRLVVARQDRRLGPKLATSTIDPDADAKLPASERRCSSLIQVGRFSSRCATIDYLIRSTLSSVSQRRVVDGTGLTGRYEIDLTWDPAFDAAAEQRQAGDPPSVVTALREQLGLRLEPIKAHLPVLVIDAVEHPSED